MRPKNLELVRSIFSLLPLNTPRKLLNFSIFQFIIVTFDILAIFLLGLLSKEGLEFIQSKKTYLEFPIVKQSLLNNYSFEKQFALVSMLILSLFLFKTLFSIMVNKWILKYLGRQSAYASNEILRRLFESNPQYIISKKSQELLYGVTTGVDSLVLYYLGSYILLKSEIVFLIVLICSLLFIQPVVGLCALFMFGGSGLLIHRFTSSAAKKKSEDSGDASILYGQQLLDAFGVYRELFLKGSISDMTSEVKFLRERYLKLRAELMFLPTYSKYLFEFVLIVGGAFVASIQIMLSDSNTAISSLIVFLAASSRILPSVIRVQGALLSMKQSEGAGQIALRQLKEFDLEKNSLSSSSEPEYHKHKSLEYLVVDDVSFQYSKSSGPVLRNINFSARRGQIVAIVGESGAGKSTLADLILGIQEPSSGIVTIQGITPRMLTNERPGTLAYVPQNISIMDGTIIRNVTLKSQKQANRDDVIKVLKRTSLWEEVKNMPEGIDSLVGEKGMMLSGGQRQRLGISRAIFSNPELIVFDEATSSLDPITEKAVTDSIYKSRNNVTLIVIAHRLSTVRNADIVLLLEKGQLLASGTFDEVRRISPKFDQQAKLVNL